MIRLPFKRVNTRCRARLHSTAPSRRLSYGSITLTLIEASPEKQSATFLLDVELKAKRTVCFLKWHPTKRDKDGPKKRFLSRLHRGGKGRRCSRNTTSPDIGRHIRRVNRESGSKCSLSHPRSSLTRPIWRPIEDVGKMVGRI